MSDWSLTTELCSITKTSSLENALFNLGLIAHENEEVSVRIDDQWMRGGSETYIFRFWIMDNHGLEKGYIMKAFVGFDLAAGVEGILHNWVTRRNILAKNGIIVPQLVTYGRGILIEELIPFHIKEMLEPSSDFKVARQLMIEMARAAGVLSRLGFLSLDAYSDLRSHGNDVVFIDFGQDLGSPRNDATGNDMMYKQFVEKMKIWDVKQFSAVEAQLFSTFLLERETQPRDF